MLAIAPIVSLWGGGERSSAWADTELEGFYIQTTKVCYTQEGMENWLNLLLSQPHLRGSEQPDDCTVLQAQTAPILVFLKKVDTYQVGTRVADIYEIHVPINSTSYALFFGYMNIAELI